jgi:hypothetical protein
MALPINRAFSWGEDPSGKLISIAKISALRPPGVSKGLKIVPTYGASSPVCF